VGLCGSVTRLVGRIGLGVRVSVKFQMFALRMLLYSAGVTSGRFSSRGYPRRNFAVASPRIGFDIAYSGESRSYLDD